MTTIVVGVDGSASSVAAPRWAVAEARLRCAKVRVVHAWHLPLLPGGEALSGDPQCVHGRRHDAERVLTRVLAHVRLEAEGIELETVAVEGRPASALVREAEDADLLVVGSRGHGGFSGLLLGSVSHQCAHLSRCPVAIVRARPDEG
ncbi:MAG: universal stress protein [Gaiellaceae bacterium]